MQRFNKLIHLFLINMCITVVASFGTNLQENGIAEVVQRLRTQLFTLPRESMWLCMVVEEEQDAGSLFDFFFEVPNNVMPREKGVGAGLYMMNLA